MWGTHPAGSVQFLSSLVRGERSLCFFDFVISSSDCAISMMFRIHNGASAESPLLLGSPGIVQYFRGLSIFVVAI